MRHGWKTRIDERRYFENKRFEREQKEIFFTMVRERLNAEMQAMNPTFHWQKEKDVH